MEEIHKIIDEVSEDTRPALAMRVRALVNEVKVLREERNRVGPAHKALDRAGVPADGLVQRINLLVDEVKTLRFLHDNDIFRISPRDYWRMIPYRDLRPEVLAFAKKMEAKLRQRDDRPHWRDGNLGDLFVGLMKEIAELAEVLPPWPESEGRGLERHSKEIAEEAVDVANYAMFIADLYGGLKS